MGCCMYIVEEISSWEEYFWEQLNLGLRRRKYFALRQNKNARQSILFAVRFLRRTTKGEKIALLPSVLTAPPSVLTGVGKK
jgi:hypothetical protein